MFGKKFVRYPALITYLCHTYLITTFKILVIEYRPIYRVLEFSYPLISVSALATKVHIGRALIFTAAAIKMRNSYVYFQFRFANWQTLIKSYLMLLSTLTS